MVKPPVIVVARIPEPGSLSAAATGCEAGLTAD